MRNRSHTALRGMVFIILMLATMEFAARVQDFVLFRAPLWANYDFDQLFVFDGNVMRGVPNKRFAKWALNSVGMRGPNPRLASGQARVVVYGASEVFGIYEPDGREFPRQLESELNARLSPARVEVVNAGIPGMRVGSGLDYLKEIGDRMRPDVVVIYPTPTHYIGVTHPNCGRPKRPPVPTNAFEWPASRLLEKTRERVKSVMPPFALSIARKGVIAWSTRNQAVLHAIDPASLSALETDIKCAIQAVRAIGAQPVLMTHANRFGNSSSSDDDYWLTGWRAQYPELAEEGFIDLERRANLSIRKIATAENVQLIDAGAALSGDRANFADHAHFSDQGATRMARLLAAELVQVHAVHRVVALDSRRESHGLLAEPAH